MTADWFAQSDDQETEEDLVWSSCVGQGYRQSTKFFGISQQPVTPALRLARTYA